MLKLGLAPETSNSTTEASLPLFLRNMKMASMNLGNAAVAWKGLEDQKRNREQDALVTPDNKSGNIE